MANANQVRIFDCAISSLPLAKGDLAILETCCLLYFDFESFVAVRSRYYSAIICSDFNRLKSSIVAFSQYFIQVTRVSIFSGFTNVQK